MMASIVSRILNVMLLAALTTQLVACSKQDDTPVKKANAAKILLIGNGDEPKDLDPHVTTGMPEAYIVRALLEGLVTRDAKTLEILPGVAESWAVSDDGLHYNFKLHHNAKWSNGEPVTATDFVWSWQRALMPALGNQYAYSLFVLENAKAFNEGKLTDFSQVGVKAKSDYELDVTLAAPTPYFLQLLDHHSFYPVHRATVEKFGKIDQQGNTWTRPGNYVGNGPFVLEEWTPNKVIAVKKSPTYWDAAAIKLNGINFYPVQQAATEERMFRAGQLHITNSVPPEKIASYRQENTGNLRIGPFFGTYFYRFNTQQKPMNDVRVRQALAYSIDRKKITDKVTKAGQIPAFTFTPPVKGGYIAEAAVPYNPELARKLLADAGYAGGTGFPITTLLYNTMDDHQKIAVALQQMWKTELGIDIQLENQDWKVYLASVQAGHYQMARAAWIGDYTDPNTFLEMFLTNGGNNETGWSNARYDQLIELAGKTGDQQQRYAYFQEAEKIIMKEVPILPIYTYVSKHLVASSVKDWPDNVLDYYPYKSVYLDDK